MKQTILFIFMFAFSLFSYENLSPAQVYARLAAGDSLQLLDVREVSEYQQGHMAEPAGMPIVVPANMPWTSGVLSANYDNLPKDIDIVVNCRSGGRSASASAFLESKGFSRIFNMTSGFSGWPYESRAGGYGDGSGAWVGVESITIGCSQEPDIAKLNFIDGGAFPDKQRYVELHKVLSGFVPFEEVQDNAFFYYIIVLDEYGLPVYKQFMDVGRSVELSMNHGDTLLKISFLSPRGEWVGDDIYKSGNIGLGSRGIIRWWRIEPKTSDRVVWQSPPSTPLLLKTYPNPFNGQLYIEAPRESLISIYDVRGRLVTKIETNTWQPHDRIGSGVYIVQMNYQGKIERKKVVYNK